MAGAVVLVIIKGRGLVMIQLMALAGVRTEVRGLLLIMAMVAV